MPNLSALAFAVDIALVSRSQQGIQSLFNLAENSLSCIGLHINPDKSNLIGIQNGILSPMSLISLDGSLINSHLQTDESIKYLGVNFRDEIVFNE